MSIKVTTEAEKVCVAKAEEAGQGHLFAGWDALGAEDQRALLSQVQRIDFQLLQRLVQQHVQQPLEQGLQAGSPGARGRVLQPAAAARLPDPVADREEYELSRTLGEYAFRNKEVMLVTAAGGGGIPPLPDPLGLLPVGPVSGKSLFQLLAEKVQALNRRYRVSLRWTIVCHPDEREKVAACFRANSYFGLQLSDVCITEQDLLPVVDRRGKILLSGPGKMVLCPNGHGGIIHRLLDEGRLEAMESAGIRHVLYFQGDNPLVALADPLFLGHHIKNQSEVTSKAVARVDPAERVGVFCRANGSLGVVEHSELAPENREARAADGSLVFSAANIGVHVFAVEFLRRARDEGLHLPFHALERATPYVDRRGRLVRPSRPNSFRFVAFAFDALLWAARAEVVQVRREDEFSPVKCASGGPCSLETARRDLSRLHARWLREACPAWRPDEGGGEPSVEIAPLFAMDAEELRERLQEPPAAAGPVLLGGRP